MSQSEPTPAETAARTRRRWITLGEVLAVIGVLISGLALWDSYSERRQSAAERAADKAKQSSVSHTLVLKAEGEGRLIRLVPHNADQAIQGQTILFPSAFGLGEIEATEPRIEAEWVKRGLKAAHEKDAKVPGDARVPVAITTRFVAGGESFTDTALYDVGYKESGGGLFGGTNVALKGVSLVGRVKPVQAQARVDAIWKARGS
ncbi:MAG: hypothetical protein JO013_09880 [Alphaproteobacteria bacterium]|nr:hypothetical protein [Alphaproteobacteria bacterium]